MVQWALGAVSSHGAVCGSSCSCLRQMHRFAIGTDVLPLLERVVSRKGFRAVPCRRGRGGPGLQLASRTDGANRRAPSN